MGKYYYKFIIDRILIKCSIEHIIRNVMKKLLFISLLSVMGMAQGFDYLIYSTGVEFKNKEMISYAVINKNGEKVGVGKNKEQKVANAQMLKKYFGKYKYKEAYEMDILATLGKKGWELITIQGKPNNSSQKYYFKRKK